MLTATIPSAHYDQPRRTAPKTGKSFVASDGGAAMVTGIDTGSPAAAASLGYRDLAYYMENVSVESVGAFCDVLRSRKTGDKIQVDFTRTYSDGSSTDFFADVTLQ